MHKEFKIHIIRNKKEINKLINSGKTFKTPSLIFHYFTDDDLIYDLQFLISIPKKKIKLAVDRNYLKRIIKECFYDTKNRNCKLNTKVSFIVVYTKSTKIKYIKLVQEILSFLEKFRQ